MPLINILRRYFAPSQKSKVSAFEHDPAIGVQKRTYSSYDAYLDHQREKLQKVSDSIKTYDQEYESIVRDRYRPLGDWSNRSVLCLAARLGGEVRAFKSLGALAIGIDIQPGSYNPHVLHGDFHQIQFPNACFDVAFTNAIDHVYQLDEFLQEVSRVLKHNGIFYVELAQVSPGKYEVLDTSDVDPIITKLHEYFTLEVHDELKNQTNYANWSGISLHLRKK